MITGKFVSCYSCAGERSDLNMDQLEEVGEQGEKRDMLVSKSTISCRPSRASTRIGSASFIFFDNFSKIILQSHLKYRAGVDFCGLDGGDWGF